MPVDGLEHARLAGETAAVFSATIISMTCRLRATSSPSARASPSATRRAGGRMASAKWAIAAASRRSVLASLPVDRAKSRI